MPRATSVPAVRDITSANGRYWVRDPVADRGGCWTIYELKASDETLPRDQWQQAWHAGAQTLSDADLVGREIMGPV